MQLNAYLNFNGQCEEAFKFYAQCLGGKIVAMVTHAGTPAAENVAPEWRAKIMHAQLDVDDQTLMGSDTPSDRFETPKGFSVSLQVKDAADAERLFEALAEGGEVRMPIQQTFWAARFGLLTDRFGVPWMVNCDPAG